MKKQISVVMHVFELMSKQQYFVPPSWRFVSQTVTKDPQLFPWATIASYLCNHARIEKKGNIFSS